MITRAALDEAIEGVRAIDQAVAAGVLTGADPAVQDDCREALAIFDAWVEQHPETERAAVSQALVRRLSSEKPGAFVSKVQPKARRRGAA